MQFLHATQGSVHTFPTASASCCPMQNSNSDPNKVNSTGASEASGPTKLSQHQICPLTIYTATSLFYLCLVATFASLPNPFPRANLASFHTSHTNTTNKTIHAFQSVSHISPRLVFKTLVAVIASPGPWVLYSTFQDTKNQNLGAGVKSCHQ